jgi:hypothetical protein
VTTRTEYKLEEARFYLAHLEQHWNHVPHVDFYLSAFISAARSITWVMNAEFSRVTGWKEWYEAKKPSSEIRTLLKAMNDVRVRSVKRVPVKTRTTANVTIPAEQLTPRVIALLQSEERHALNLEPIDETHTVFFIKHGDEILAKAHLNSAAHELPEFKGRDAKDVCREYLVELEGLVSECISTFKP